MPAPINEDYLDLGDEYEEVKGNGGGDFPPVHDFNAEPKLEAVYQGFVVKPINGDDRVIHTFTTPEGTEVQAWGSAILDSRLEGLEGSKVCVVKTGRKITTSKGRQAWEWKVGVAKAAKVTG